jgi:hypothetical protein
MRTEHTQNCLARGFAGEAREPLRELLSHCIRDAIGQNFYEYSNSADYMSGEQSYLRRRRRASKPKPLSRAADGSGIAVICTAETTAASLI